MERSGWPLPGVFSPLDLAKSFLKRISRLKSKIPELEAFAFVASQRPEIPLLKLFDEFLQAKRLRKFARPAYFGRVLEMNADSENKELAPATFGAVYINLLLENLAESTDRVAHDFSYLEVVGENFDASRVEFHRFLNKKQIMHLGFRQLYSAESEFLERLAGHFEIVEQFAGRASHENTSLEENDSLELQSHQQVLWIGGASAPGPLESKLLTGYPTQLKTSVDAALTQFNEHVEKLKVEFSPSALLEVASRYREPVIKDLVKRIIVENQPQHLDMLNALSFFPRDIVSRGFVEKAYLGQPLLLEWEDVPILNPKQTLLWGNLETWKTFLTELPDRGSHLNIPTEVEKYWLAEGLVLPSVVEEQKQLQEIVNRWAPEFKFLRATAKDKLAQTSEAKTVKALPSKLLSPSSLENLARCPLQFYFAKELRLPVIESPDDLAGSPMRRGNWIHQVLEKLDWSDIRKVKAKNIERILAAEVVSAFKDFASEDYVKILQAQITNMALAIEFYLQKIEAPLQNLFPNRRIESEKDIFCQWNHKVGIRGRVDRLDFVGDGALLWDYKTGNFSSTKLATNMENGKFQWLLYREIFEREGTPIFGGGYLNPLDLKKSRLVFFSGAPFAGEFYDDLKNLGVRVELISSTEESQMRDRLKEKIEVLMSLWLGPTRRAQPLNDETCGTCDYQGFCGRPFGVLAP